MRAIALAGMVGAVLLAAVPAGAASNNWHSYISHQLGFSVEMPGTVKTEKASYKAAVAGEREGVTYESMDNGIDYKITVLDFTKDPQEGSRYMEEAAYILQEDKHVLMNDFGRVEPGKDAVYGRKMTFDLPDKGGRVTSAVYFTRGHLFELTATVLPENGDYATPDAGRFVDSLVFVLSRTEPGATELGVPK
jgi:hypothetical protein